MASPENLKKYQKEKFESYKKINNLRINDNEAYIEIKVKDYNNIISDYSLEENPVLKQEFIEVLEIHNDNYSSEEKIIIRKLIKNHFTFISINKESELKRLRQKIKYLLIVGIVTFIISMLLVNIDFMIPFFEILNFITWYCIWECGSLILFAEDDLKEEIIKYKHLSTIRVVYNKEKNKKN